MTGTFAVQVNTSLQQSQIGLSVIVATFDTLGQTAPTRIQLFTISSRSPTFPASYAASLRTYLPPLATQVSINAANGFTPWRLFSNTQSTAVCSASLQCLVACVPGQFLLGTCNRTAQTYCLPCTDCNAVPGTFIAGNASLLR